MGYGATVRPPPAGDRDSALACAGTLQPFWEESVRGLTSKETGPTGTLLNKALRTAVALGDAAAAPSVPGGDAGRGAR